ncbi:hypothetical protein HELRODRAFT_166720 [Helobdella robusta]|uniref:WSC domain-containing protein n=1 Tax=Helobdella robusta TaxID=6412 RepID=T1EYF4_HELRO|nr:hypothetical protein HELRODRAFT_166720 [Helobdella robusta]ESO11704.1 hypothetical protein HELRODRAFT_166720 [Helobdella robusta]
MSFILCTFCLIYLFGSSLQMWSDESKKLFENCYEDRKGRSIQLHDDVTGSGAPALDICLEKCRSKKVTFMALKVNACFCFEKYPLEWIRVDPTICRKGRFGSQCENRCHCNELPCRVKDGLCHMRDSSCQKNWLGKACNLSGLTHVF